MCAARRRDAVSAVRRMALMLDLTVRYFNGRDGPARLPRARRGPAIDPHPRLSREQRTLAALRSCSEADAIGYRVVMPDVRAHGDSDCSHDASAYPPDSLADDGFALLEHLGLGARDYDLGGYSLGARTTIRMLAQGATPGRAIVAGMGLEGIVHTAGRGGQFRHLLTNLGTFEFGSPDWKAEAYLRKIGADPVALLLALGTTVDTSPEELAAIEPPTLILVGAEDQRHNSAEALAAAACARTVRRRAGRSRECVRTASSETRSRRFSAQQSPARRSRASSASAFAADGRAASGAIAGQLAGKFSCSKFARLRFRPQRPDRLCRSVSMLVGQSHCSNERKKIGDAPRLIRPYPYSPGCIQAGSKLARMTSSPSALLDRTGTWRLAKRSGGREMASMHDARTVSPRSRRLTPGPGGLPRGQVTEIQRGRMLAAAVDAVDALAMRA